ncbi:AAA family ATPase [Alteromonas sp. McT4-15]|uniref:AAA family ATPase n=1 Tax=Alteromonas sp. McT4-15 TaxID=2881256 RepID=UPI001CF901E7|nr:AAA family ATPase [Alteromonas sp. McT4-15]MCB4438494.1 AAA family ATPase [Alteromonas sp. McT4-15]
MELSIEGYKSIASKKQLEINGLTILSGANSSGKSSFMQPFLVLKQTIENHYDSGFLQLLGENAKLTDSTQLISKVPGYKRKSFSIEMKNGTRCSSLSYKYKRGYGLQIESTRLSDQDKGIDITLKVGMRHEDIASRLPSEDFEFINKFYEEKDIRPKWKAYRNKCFIEAELSFDEANFIPVKAGLEPATQIERLVTRLIHVPGLRGNPERSYKIAASEDVYPGSFEKYVAAIISNWSKQNKFKAKYDELIKHLKILGLASNIKTSKVNDTSVEIQISRSENSEKADCVNIADVGFGVSQTLPVLVALLAAKKNQCVYIEQPELHLHPKAQFKLANIINTAVNRGVKVIIETHSSILIRGIQIAVVKRELEKEKVSLNWFTQDSKSGETNVANAKLDEFGAFGEWPEDFDDTSLMVEQMYLDEVEALAHEKS